MSTTWFCEDNFLTYIFHNLNLHRPRPFGLCREKSSGVVVAVLRLHQEQLLAFDVMHLRPVDLGLALDVIEADTEHARVEALDLDLQAVAVVHDQHVGRFSCSERRNKSAPLPLSYARQCRVRAPAARDGA